MLYDCVLFSNELDLLEVRLHELRDVVDYHVIIEGRHDFTGKQKPLHFDKNRERFSEFSGKLISIIIPEFPENNTRWENEFFSRNFVSGALENCQPDDWVMMSDADEIPKPWHLKNPYQCTMSMETFYYNLNTVSEQYLRGPTMTQYKDFTTGQELRNLRNYLPVIENGAWHFSFFGGIENIQTKLSQFAHVEYDDDYYKDSERLQLAVKNQRDLFGRDIPMHYEKINDTLPKYIVDNLERFQQWLA